MTYTIKETVWNEVISRLKGIDYIKEVFAGHREVDLNGLYPCIRIDLLPSEEAWTDQPRRRAGILNIAIYGQLNVVGRIDKQIIGDNKSPGILRFEEDILKALEGSDIGYSDYVDNYTVAVVDNRIINNTIREVVINLGLKLKTFSAQSRV